MRQATELRLTGDLAADSFLEWICHRARLLDLNGWVRRPAAGRVEIVISGPAALVDAMEMACSLGPAEVLVNRIESRARSLGDTPDGFHVRR